MCVYECEHVSVFTCGKKNPDIQNTSGCPLTSQLRMNAMRAWKSFTHDASGFSDGYAAASQFLGTWLFSSAVYILTRESTHTSIKYVNQTTTVAYMHEI